MWDWIKKAAKNTWEFVDGSKTTIGFVLVTGGKLLPSPWDTVAEIAGTVIGGTGALHKGQKYYKDGGGKEKIQKLVTKLKEEV